MTSPPLFARSLPCALVVALAPHAAAAGDAPLELRGAPSFSAGPGLEDLVLADFVEDGAPDAVCASVVGVFLVPADGAGGFGAPSALPALIGGFPRSVATGDFDGDGHADVAVTLVDNLHVDERVGILLGDGLGGFTVAGYAPAGDGGVDLVAADLDGDGHTDLVTAELSGDAATVLLGDGAGGFAVSAVLATPTVPAAVAAGDWTGDGALDLVVGGLVETLLYVGAGDGTYAAGVPVPGGGGALGASEVVAADVDADGALDLVLCSSELVVLRGDGTGGFAPPLRTPVPAFRACVADLDGDGVLDAAVADGTTTRVLRGDGTGLFVEEQRLATATSPAAVLAADLDGDGVPEVVQGSGNGRLTVLARPAGSGLPFRGAPASPIASTSNDLLVADFTGDSTADLAVGAYFGVALLAGDGAGGFAWNGAVAPCGQYVLDLAVADFDGDGALDVAAGDLAGSAAIALGDGAGGFAAPASVGGLGSVYGLVAADLDGDGHADLAAATRDPDRVVVLAGDGAGGLALGAGLSLPEDPLGIDAADVDEDGDVDLVVAHRVVGTAKLTVLLGDGAGGFTPGAVLDAGSGGRVIAADLDGDGHVDLAATDGGGVTVALGHGDGTFDPATDVAGGPTQEDLCAADLDGDGLLDLAAASLSGGAVTLFSNRGAGVFEVAAVYATAGGTRAIGAADLDGDGRTDLVAAGRDSELLTLFSNDAVFEPRRFCAAQPNSTGQPARMAWRGTTSVAANELVLEADRLPAGASAVFVYSPDRAATPLGNGILCVGADTLGFVVRLAPGASDAAGHVEHALDVTAPSDPAAAILPGTTWAFTCWYRDVPAGGAGFDFADGLEVTFAP